MDRFDREIVKFVLRWVPFGGPPEEDVLPQFGLTTGQLARRFDRIVSSLVSAERTLTSDENELLVALIRVSRERGGIGSPDPARCFAFGLANPAGIKCEPTRGDIATLIHRASVWQLLSGDPGAAAVDRDPHAHAGLPIRSDGIPPVGSADGATRVAARA